MASAQTALAPGARILIRDAEWLVRSVDATSTGGKALGVVGISELVKDKEALFLTEIEGDDGIAVLDPAETRLVPDRSPNYRAALLYMESLLRQTPPTEGGITIGHRAAMDAVPYQLDPALQALEQPRQRILIADAVGLGKTLESGILVAELMRRGRGKRILVATVKSMLTQFQKEFWSRFTIPLTRLDSIGLQRIRGHIPTNHNPFHYYDKAIISIDTLKQDVEYRSYLENAWWDIIIIDEAHNVAERRGGSSQRARLARLLATRSDTLIMLSATPHDGSARSFASLMNMLDPTAIADPDNYSRDDIQGLFIRRFKKDIQHQVDSAFKEREIGVVRSRASAPEEAAFAALTGLRFTRAEQRGAGELFRTTLEKALFSSPAACLATIEQRVRRLRRDAEQTGAYGDAQVAEADIRALKQVAERVAAIDLVDFSKYQRLLELLREPGQTHGAAGYGWTGRDTDDRLVIFTERIDTLRFLHEHLPEDLGLPDQAVGLLHGTLADVEQQRIVEDFGKEESPLRLLLASDVAAEGINLHYLSHRLIHFDIPWSLMLFQQRNGRIDRYGQPRVPRIHYLITDSDNAKIRGDTRILELLIEKDEQAVKNIGDPAAFMGVYDIAAEERITASAIEEGKDAETFEQELAAPGDADWDVLALIMGDAPPPASASTAGVTRDLPTLFHSDFHYLQAALEHLDAHRSLQTSISADRELIELTAPPDLAQRFASLPREVWPRDGRFVLSRDRDLIQREIARARRDEHAWPTVQYLWELHPVLHWANDQVLAAFGRHEAPVLTLRDGLADGETVFVLSGLIPNRKGHPLVHRWLGVGFQREQSRGIEPFDALLQRTGLHRRRLANPGADMDTAPLAALLPAAVEEARDWMHGERKAFEDAINAKLNDHLSALEQLRARQRHQLELRYADNRQPLALTQGKREQAHRRIEQLFDDYMQWIEDTMTTEDQAYIQVVAVLRGAGDT